MLYFYEPSYSPRDRAVTNTVLDSIDASIVAISVDVIASVVLAIVTKLNCLIYSNQLFNNTSFKIAHVTAHKSNLFVTVVVMLKLTTGYLPTVPRRLHTVASTTKFTIQTERMATTEVSFNPEEINIKLDNVKNMRDLAAISDKILPNKVIRTGCVSKASTSDVSSFYTVNCNSSTMQQCDEVDVTSSK